MPDNAIETVVDLERQVLDLYQELSALRDFEDAAMEADERFEDLIARLKVAALTTIDDIRHLIAHMDRSNTDKASLILLLAIGFAGEVRAIEKARKQNACEVGQTWYPRSSSNDRPRKDL